MCSRLMIDLSSASLASLVPKSLVPKLHLCTCSLVPKLHLGTYLSCQLDWLDCRDHGWRKGK